MRQSLEEMVDCFITNRKKPTQLKAIKNPKKLSQDKEFKALYSLVMDTEENKKYALEKISEALADMDLLSACAAAHFCGAIIEAIGVQQAGERIVDLFTVMVLGACGYLAEVKEVLGIADEALTPEIIAKANPAILFQKNAENAKAYAGCELISLALMAVITRDKEARILLRKKGIYQHIRYLQQFQNTVSYVVTVYESCTNLAITVLAPAVKKGFCIQVNDLANCFHLMTLLEAELYQKGLLEAYGIQGYEWNSAIYQIATGEKLPTRNYSILAHQQYYTYRAVNKNGEYDILLETPEGKQINADTLVWGEMPPEAIVPFFDEVIIIMDSKGMFAGRSWDVGFINKCHNALKPEVKIIKELTEEEFLSYWEKLLQAAAAE